MDPFEAGVSSGRRRHRAPAVVACAVAVALVVARPAIFIAQPPALTIVVLEGEDAVNIIQQKTAVAPVVEVRDANQLPVAGAAVTFVIGSGGGGSFAGARTLTVTTNAAGRAAAGGITVTAPGHMQILVSASVQDQIAYATITQTNYPTAQAAAAASAGSTHPGSGGASAAGGDAGGGALSGGVIAAIAGGGAAAAGVAVKAAGGNHDPTPTPAPTPVPTPTLPAATSYNVSGPVDWPVTATWVFPPSYGSTTCSEQGSYKGTARLTATVSGTGVVAGTLQLDLLLSFSGVVSCNGVVSSVVRPPYDPVTYYLPVTGTSNAVVGTFGASGGPLFVQFSGRLTTGVADGTLSIEWPTNDGVSTGRTVGTTTITLR